MDLNDLLQLIMWIKKQQLTLMLSEEQISKIRGGASTQEILTSYLKIKNLTEFNNFVWIVIPEKEKRIIKYSQL